MGIDVNFQCQYADDDSNGSVFEILWGQKERGQWLPPHSPLDSYQFINIYASDSAVQSLLEDVIRSYRTSLRQNVEMATKVTGKPWQCFAGHIMYSLLDRKLMSLTQTESKQTEDTDDEEMLTTTVKLGNIYFLTRELKVVPGTDSSHLRVVDFWHR